ncbi:MAG TPA: hypothetical protein VGQ83_02375 [Polyangia bacterium]|jgi:hypothetical protein
MKLLVRKQTRNVTLTQAPARTSVRSHCNRHCHAPRHCNRA